MKSFKKMVFFTVLLTLALGFSDLGARTQSLTGRARPYFRGARTEMQGQRFELALDRFKSVLEHQPDHVESRWRTANLYFMFAGEADTDEEARDLYRTAYNHFRLCIETINNMPDWQRFTDFDTWLEDCDLKIQSIWVRFFRMGHELYQDEDFDGAVAVLYELMEIAPEKSETYVLLASIADQRGDVRQAIAYFAKILEFEPANIQVIANIATEYQKMDDWTNAKLYYQRVIDLEPDNVFGHFNMAVANLQTDNYQAALANWEAALRLEPNDVDLLDNAIRTAQTLGNDDKVIELLKRMVEIDDSVENVADLCYQLVRTQRWEDLITYGRLWHQKDPSSREAVQFVMHAANQLNNQALAREYQEILRRMN
jgi:tetratricopeptide (TPR) repeat protein